MDKIKSFLLEQEVELEKMENEQVEVFGDSIDECLLLAARHLNKDIHQLDYTVLKRGKKNLFFPEPFHVRVFQAKHEDDMDILKPLDEALGTGGRLLNENLKTFIIPDNIDASCIIKNYRSGVYMACFPPKGEGKPLTTDYILKKFGIKGITAPDPAKVQKILEESSSEFIRVGNSKLRAFMEAQIKADITTDWTKATVTLVPPKPGGRDIETSDVVYELKRQGVEYGIKEDTIKKMIDEDRYNEAFIAAEADPPVHGKNAQIVYHVRLDKKITLKEDASGKVDFKDLNLIENVVIGQLLAEKVPAEKGKYGRNLINEIIEAKDGQDVQLLPGNGTILSEDQKRLTAEVNGQVIFIDGRLSVETVYKINGDVGMKTGNVTFLGSIVITGNVEDNFHVKASGNIEIYGTVQKAVIEADGDIIIRQGVTGRDEARIESTGGNIIAKFIQNANVITDKDVIVQEGIIHSNISAGGKISCKGRKAQIVGGKLMATHQISAKVVGSASNPTTDLIVGVNPKIIKQIEDYHAKKKETQGTLDQLQKSLKTLIARREVDPLQFSEEQQDYMNKYEAQIKKMERRILEYDTEILKLQEYMEKSGGTGRIYIEKMKYRGVSVQIKNIEDREIAMQEMGGCVLYLDVDRIRSSKYVDPDAVEKEETTKKSKQKSKVSVST
jgi:uncharacterized protein